MFEAFLTSFFSFLFSKYLLLVLFSGWIVSDSLWPLALQHARLFPCPPLSVSQSLLKFMSIELVMLSNHLILCCPLLLLPSFFPSIRVFSKVLALGIRWPKYWSFRFSTSPSNEYSGLISFRIDWFDLLTAQGTFKRLHHHSVEGTINETASYLCHTLKKTQKDWGSHLNLYSWWKAELRLKGLTPF